MVPAHQGILHADAAPDGRAHVSDDGIGAGFSHLDGFIRRTHVDDGEEIHATGEVHHLVFFLHAHAGLFEHAAEVSVDDGVGGEIVHAGETHLFHLAQPMPHATTGIGRMNAADNRAFFDDRQDFVFTDVHGDGIGVTVGHHAGGGAVAHHAEATAVVDDNEIGAAFFDELGADARAGSGCDNSVVFIERGLQAFANFFAGVGITDSGPGVGHKLFGLMWGSHGGPGG